MHPIRITLVSPLFVVGVAMLLASLRTSYSAPDDSEIRLKKVYTSAYSYFDNTPPGSPEVAYAKQDGFPTIHNIASGTGTWDDPITAAVGWVKEGKTPKPDFSPGTRFYIPNLRRYFIVEDLCGDAKNGTLPQDIPCHKLTPDVIDLGASLWIDLWIEGKGGTIADADKCATKLTDVHLVIENPKSTYVVTAGPVYDSIHGCARQWGDKAVLGK